MIIKTVLSVALGAMLAANGTAYLPKFEIKQAGKSHALSTSGTLSLKKDQFTVLFNSKNYDSKNNEAYATMMVLAQKKKLVAGIREGVKIASIPCLAPGSGMATKGEYNPYFVTATADRGHHYIMYDKRDEQRAKLESVNNGILRLKCNVSRLNFKGKTASVKDSKAKKIYLALVHDANLNGTIDKGEYAVTTLKLK